MLCFVSLFQYDTGDGKRKSLAEIGLDQFRKQVRGVRVMFTMYHTGSSLSHHIYCRFDIIFSLLYHPIFCLQDGFESVMGFGLPWPQWRVPVCISYEGLFIHDEIETGA